MGLVFVCGFGGVLRWVWFGLYGLGLMGLLDLGVWVMVLLACVFDVFDWCWWTCYGILMLLCVALLFCLCGLGCSCWFGCLFDCCGCGVICVIVLELGWDCGCVIVILFWLVLFWWVVEHYVAWGVGVWLVFCCVVGYLLFMCFVRLL